MLVPLTTMSEKFCKIRKSVIMSSVIFGSTAASAGLKASIVRFERLIACICKSNAIPTVSDAVGAKLGEGVGVGVGSMVGRGGTSEPFT